MHPTPHSLPAPGGKAVLLVDDEPALLAGMSDGLRALDSTLGVLTATSAEEALRILGQAQVHAVVTDLCMPGKDGFWLLLELQRRMPDLPAIVCSSALTPAACYRIERAGVLECLHKPVSPRTLHQKIMQVVGPAAKRGSIIRGIALASILQLLELEQKTCVVTISASGQTGKIFVVQGAVHDARCSSVTGISAAFRMLGWPQTEISIDEHGDSSISDVIQMSVTSLVMEAAQQIDEQHGPPGQPESVEAFSFTNAPNGEIPVAENAIEAAELNPDDFPELDSESFQELAKVAARVRFLNATDIFEKGYEALKRGSLHLALEIMRLALAKEPDNRLIQHNLKVVEKKIAASPIAR